MSLAVTSCGPLTSSLLGVPVPSWHAVTSPFCGLTVMMPGKVTSVHVRDDLPDGYVAESYRASLTRDRTYLVKCTKNSNGVKPKEGGMDFGRTMGLGFEKLYGTNVTLTADSVGACAGWRMRFRVPEEGTYFLGRMYATDGIFFELTASVAPTDPEEGYAKRFFDSFHAEACDAATQAPAE